MISNPTYRGVVYPWHCDHMGHMNVMWYVGKFDEATWNMFAELGLTSSYLKARNRGMAAVEQNLTYARELHPGDTLEINSRVLEAKPKSLRFTLEMVTGTDADLCATCTITALHLDTSTRRAVAFADEIFAQLQNAAAATAS